MREIKLYNGMVAQVDDEDFDRINSFKWSAQKMGLVWYAMSSKWNKETKRVVTVRMHRVILNLGQAKPFVDHKDRNGLNNQRDNLRVCVQSQNTANQRKKEGKTSKYFGVNLDKKTGKWRAQIKKNGKKYYLGRYDTEERAALAYNEKAKELHKEFSHLNTL